ncbi:MAG: hypothetical protein KBD64_07065 [Gammaproteobacteria bacterium]|nr:hypothetical protein [Gammaproteobacteria bacterium]
MATPHEFIPIEPGAPSAVAAIYSPQPQTTSKSPRLRKFLIGAAIVSGILLVAAITAAVCVFVPGTAPLVLLGLGTIGKYFIIAVGAGAVTTGSVLAIGVGAALSALTLGGIGTWIGFKIAKLCKAVASAVKSEKPIIGAPCADDLILVTTGISHGRTPLAAATGAPMITPEAPQEGMRPTP